MYHFTCLRMKCRMPLRRKPLLESSYSSAHAARLGNQQLEVSLTTTSTATAVNVNQGRWTDNLLPSSLLSLLLHPIPLWPWEEAPHRQDKLQYQHSLCLRLTQ